MYVLRAGRVWIYSGARENPVHRAFYRDGEYFGELAMLNDAPRAASAEAITDCELLLLKPDSVRQLRTRFPEFDRLLSERIAQYRGDGEARIPLDFAEELLPADAADARVSVKPADAVDSDDASASQPRARIRRFKHIQQIDEMDCGAACFAMVCRHFGRAVSLPRGQPAAHSPAVPYRDGRHQPKRAVCGRHRTWSGGARAENFAAASRSDAVTGDLPLGGQSLGGAVSPRCHARLHCRPRARLHEIAARRVPEKMERLRGAV